MPKKQPIPHASIVPEERIERRILLLRGLKVMLSTDLALLYDVPAKRIGETVGRNKDRFPPDFMFQLTWAETRSLRSQIATLDQQEHFRYRPYAFIEEGIAMLSAVLRSPTAIAVSIQIMRAFVRLRQIIASHDHLRDKLDDLENKLLDHDEKFSLVFDAIRQLMDADADESSKPRIGYHTESKPSEKSE
jgi:hypothetical protein